MDRKGRREGGREAGREREFQNSSTDPALRVVILMSLHKED
jgi:hypothetical protein